MGKIPKIWNDCSYPFTARDVSRNLHKILGVKIIEKVILQILKGSLGLSYKKRKSCPVDLSQNRQQLLKCLFSAKMSQYLSKYEILVNIDESSFSRRTKLDYSWQKKGQPWKLINIGFRNSSSLISAMTTTGKVFVAITIGSVNTSVFIKYLSVLKKFTKAKEKKFLNKCLIIIDNAVIHRSKKLQEYVNENDIRVAYIPPYMLDLTPIERLFGKLKHSILKKVIGRIIDLFYQKRPTYYSKIPLKSLTN